MTVRKQVDSSDRQIVIIGGGAIGSCAAYFLTRHPLYDPRHHSITILEATRIAGGASGKAAGCLGRWADPGCLGAASFELHAQLAKDHSGETAWGYRRVTSADCDAVRSHDDDNGDEAGSTANDKGLHSPDDVDWVKSSAFKWFKPLGETAQVHPYQFSNELARLAQEQGAKLLIGKAKSINYTREKDEVKSVDFQPHDSDETRQLLATDIIVAAGPWTNSILPEAPIGGEKSHSIVVDPKRTISGSILFFDPGNIDATDAENQLEIYPRPDHTVYMSGQTDFGTKLPDTTDEVHIDEGRCEKILSTVKIVSEDLHASEILIKQACFRPMVYVKGRDVELGPLLGKTGIKGLLLAAGHNQWGIQNSPITGKVLSELVFEGEAKAADISVLDPRDHVHFDKQ